MEKIVHTRELLNAYTFIHRFKTENTNRFHQYDHDKPSAIEVDRYTNKIKSISFYTFSLLHRDHDKPSFICRYRDNEKIEFWWHKEGQFHRDNDQPARIVINVLGTYEYSWYKNGQLHRDDDKPACVYTDGDIEQFTWYQNGLKHRNNNDQPAYIYRRDTVHESAWYVNGKLHRDTPHASVIRRNSNIHYRAYYKHGLLHRLNGPATISLNTITSTINYFSLFICGVEHNSLPICYPPTPIMNYFWVQDGLKVFNPFIGNVILKFIARMKLKYKKRKEQEILSLTSILSNDSVDQIMAYIA